MPLRVMQRVTYMERELSLLLLGQQDRICVSTITPYDSTDDRDQYWETMVFGITDDGKWHLTKTLHNYTRLSNGDSLQERDAQHGAVLSRLQQAMYKEVKEEDDLNIRGKTWDKLLEGIPSLDFTPEELRKIEFLKYLHANGKI